VARPFAGAVAAGLTLAEWSRAKALSRGLWDEQRYSENCPSMLKACRDSRMGAAREMPMTIIETPSPNFDERTLGISMIVLH